MKNMSTLLFLTTAFLFITIVNSQLFGQTGTLSLKPLIDSDDAEQEIGDGTMDTGSSDLELGGFDGSTEQIVGIRFPNVTLPSGSVITNAYIQFSVDETDGNAASITIKAQQGNAATYTETDGDITNRSYTGSSVIWNPAAWNSVGDRGVNQRTADLTTLISEAIQTGFSSGDALAFSFSSTQDLGERTAEPIDSGVSSAPELIIEYISSSINITGVGYNIQANDDLDFLFVTNFGTQSIQVGGDSITSAISFAFPFGTTLGAGETVMITRDQEKYPDITMTKYEWASGKLSDEGEQLIYKTAAGVIVNNFIYDDVIPWPAQAGNGSSYLNLIADNLDNTQATNWEAVDAATLGRKTLVDPLVFQNYGINIVGVGYNIPVEAGIEDEDLEFIFVTNFGTQNRVVAGDSIVKGIDFAFPAGTIIPAGDTVMITKDLSKYPDITLPKFKFNGSKLSNGGEQIAYKNAAGQIINDFTYRDTIPWPIAADGNGSYLKLNAPSLDNAVPQNWQAENISTLGQLTQVNPQVFQNYGINIVGIGYNILDNAGIGDDNLEFLFISNFGTQNRVVAGDSIVNGIDFTFPAGATIPAGDTVMITRDLTKYPDISFPKYAWSGGKLSNGGERITYKNSTGNIINDLTYIDTIPWPVAADGNGSYLKLISTNLNNALAQNWEAGDMATLGRTSSIDPVVFQNYGINITGVGYNNVNPGGMEDPNLEFLFVTNFGTQNRLVAGDSIFQGINFGFPAGSMIAAGETVMITRDLEKYPDVMMTKYEWSDGQLNNGGEQISYKNAAGDIVNDFTYNDAVPWPIQADGGGFYLQLNADNIDNRIPGNWQAVNLTSLGRQSSFDPIVFQNYGINITGVGYNISDASGIADDSLDFLLVTNFGTQARLVAGDSIFQGIKFAFPAGATIAVGETVMITKDLTKYPDVTMTKYVWIDGKLSNGGERVAYKNAAGDLINDFIYDNLLPWPTEPDGGGYYLQLNADNLDNRVPGNWQAIPLSTLGALCEDADGDGLCDTTKQCQTDVSQTGNATITESVYAQNSIISDGLVLTGSDIEFAAGNNIQLIQNFEVQAGAVFSAYIQSCTN